MNFEPPPPPVTPCSKKLFLAHRHIDDLLKLAILCRVWCADQRVLKDTETFRSNDYEILCILCILTEPVRLFLALIRNEQTCEQKHNIRTSTKILQ